MSFCQFRKAICGNLLSEQLRCFRANSEYLRFTFVSVIAAEQIPMTKHQSMYSNKCGTVAAQTCKRNSIKGTVTLFVEPISTFIEVSLDAVKRVCMKNSTASNQALCWYAYKF